jgi:hypothetical protein
MSNLLPVGHVWSYREVQIKGKAYAHRQCRKCGRDFVMLPGSARWTAVHVGVFEFVPLEDDTNSRWMSQLCPGRPLPGERNAASKRSGKV